MDSGELEKSTRWSWTTLLQSTMGKRERIPSLIRNLGRLCFLQLLLWKCRTTFGMRHACTVQCLKSSRHQTCREHCGEAATSRANPRCTRKNKLPSPSGYSEGFCGEGGVTQDDCWRWKESWIYFLPSSISASLAEGIQKVEGKRDCHSKSCIYNTEVSTQCPESPTGNISGVTNNLITVCN